MTIWMALRTLKYAVYTIKFALFRSLLASRAEHNDCPIDVVICKGAHIVLLWSNCLKDLLKVMRNVKVVVHQIFLQNEISNGFLVLVLNDQITIKLCF